MGLMKHQQVLSLSSSFTTPYSSSSTTTSSSSPSMSCSLLYLVHTS
ncbi:unnamed protein product [Arabidopsis lyrata]|nr:unnamed protein product [Arabidopsis lyrata]